MKNLFLTSSVNFVAHDIAKKIEGHGKKLVFIDTAAEVEDGDLQWLKDDRNALVKAGFTVTDYTLTKKTKSEVKKTLAAADILYFSGGNAFWLLEQIQQSESAGVITDFVEQGKIYIGTSSGSIVAGPDIYPALRIVPRKKAKFLRGYEGLGLVDFVTLPHWGDRDFKDLYMNFCLEHAYTTKHKLILLTDNQYVWVKDEWYRIVDVRPQ